MVVIDQSASVAERFSVLHAERIHGTGARIPAAPRSRLGSGFNLVGPSFAHLPDVSKVTLTLAMWVGRLEVLTGLAHLEPEVWPTMR